jgi:hypothetical protein
VNTIIYSVSKAKKFLREVSFNRTINCAGKSFIISEMAEISETILIDLTLFAIKALVMGSL